MIKTSEDGLSISMKYRSLNGVTRSIMYCPFNPVDWVLKDAKLTKPLIGSIGIAMPRNMSKIYSYEIRIKTNKRFF
ncbi:MAG: hypothetical protein KA715_06505 [Xanthomonadaceae bacterium]|nr:hypothetical protein [Xanthomonadaceae bacterium]